ncbi:hypothetical protein HON71_01335 [Candidatus Woesearchaeota archaeon]|jgi:hypothetical protein|nr:hypothetical protein [Candidatus Woesearchaeota archaeon]MBT5342348.1 hypothetical protein [Candidatus Woesearchaeota archaeon]
MNEHYEILNVEFPGLPKELKVPRDAVHRGEAILQRFYEPNHHEVSVPRNEINHHSKHGTFRAPEFCYGFKVPIDDKVTIVGTHDKLNHTLDLMAGYDVSRVLGRELVKLLVAKKFTEAYKSAAEKGDKEASEMISELDSAVEKAWKRTMNS